MKPVDLVVLIAGAAMVVYGVFGGADFGGGVWSMLASGPRTEEQRSAVTAAIGPVWEAHHVWLIYIIVLSFTCFPAAYAEVTVGLYLPLTIALLGIVLRGVAFVFGTFAAGAPRTKGVLTTTFGIASLIAPFAFGDCIGAVATGTFSYTAPFALAVGLFAVAVCAQAAATFILLEIHDKPLRDDFRRRAVGSTFVTWLTGVLPIVLLRHADVSVRNSLGHAGAGAALIVAVLAGACLIVCVCRHRDALARVFVVVQGAAIFGGWFGAQVPQLLPGRYTYAQAAAGDAMLVAFLCATLGGLIILVPSLLLLFSIFKSARALRLAPPGEVR